MVAIEHNIKGRWQWCNGYYIGYKVQYCGEYLYCTIEHYRVNSGGYRAQYKGGGGGNGAMGAMGAILATECNIAEKGSPDEGRL